MTTKVFQQGAIILPDELTETDFLHLAKLGLELTVGDETYYFDPKSRHKYPSWLPYPRGFRTRYNWKRVTTYMSKWEFIRIVRRGGIVHKPAKQPRLSRSKPYES